MYLCLCHAVTDKTVRELVRSGSSTVKDIQKRCLAGTDCGACLSHISELVQEQDKSVSNS